MTGTVQAVLADALRLDPESRTVLAGVLESTEPAWDAVIRRRVTAIEAGTQNLGPWKEVPRRVERKIRNR